MAAEEGTEPVADDEILYRRVTENSGWYEPGSDRPVAWVAFRPNQNDVRGLSVWRAKYKTAREAALIGAKRGQRYFVMVLRAARLRAAGVAVEPTAHEGGAGHASLADLNTQAYKTDKNRVQAIAEIIASQLVESIEGPFGPIDP
jgi:hypothetical protein